MIKKIYTINIITLLLSTSQFSSIERLSINSQDQTIQKKHTKRYDEFPKKNNAWTEDYGTYTSAQYRKLRLNISMTSTMYAFFLAAIQYSQEAFTSLFLTNDISSMHPEWLITQNAIKNSLLTAAEHRTLPPNYFYDIFYNWLKSKDKFNIFENIYQAKDLTSCTFNIPLLPQPALGRQLVAEFRRQGVILQFDFVYTSLAATQYTLSDLRIFPYISGVMGLIHYYQTVSYDPERTLLFHPPLIRIDMKPPFVRPVTVWGIIRLINANLKYSFGFKNQFSYDHYVKIPSSQSRKPISQIPSRPTLISFNFCSASAGNVVYTTKNIRLYYVKV